LTDRLIAVSEDEREETLKRRIVPGARLPVVRSGITPDTLPHMADGDAKRLEVGWGPRGSRVVVGTVGRMALQKDPLTWLRAAAQAAARRPELHFVWIMGGELEAEALACARELGLESSGRFQFFGYRPDARELIAGFDVFALSSVFEAGLCYVLMEAMALERPVIAAAGVGSRRAIHDGVNGLLVPVADPGALADAMVRLADDPDLRRRLGSAGRDLVLQHYTVEHQVAETERVYFDALGLPMTARATPAVSA
jgi:glycosyltransferase involved in cell wall biosynthesis